MFNIFNNVNNFKIIILKTKQKQVDIRNLGISFLLSSEKLTH